MDYALKCLAASLSFVNLFAQTDPQETLAQARDKLRTMSASKFSCVETIDRSYYSRATPPISAESCERINIERKKGAKLHLDSTDRIRLAVSLAQGQEIFSWVQPGPFSGDVDTLMHTGPIGTGAMATFLAEVLENPETRFEFLGESAKNLKFHFRVRIESNHYLIGTSTGWSAAGFEGTLLIDPTTFEVAHLSLETGELPAETSICSVQAEIEFQSVKLAGAETLLPLRAETRHVMRDAMETNNVTTVSDCAALKAPPARPSTPPALPVDLIVRMTFDQPIDTDAAAAGDLIAATLTQPVLEPKSNDVLAPTGSHVTGRIVRMQHEFGPKTGFVIGISFETIVIRGIAEPFSARLTAPSAHGTLVFSTNKPRHVIPAGFATEWRTTQVAAK